MEVQRDDGVKMVWREFKELITVAAEKIVGEAKGVRLERQPDGGAMKYKEGSERGKIYNYEKA